MGQDRCHGHCTPQRAIARLGSLTACSCGVWDQFTACGFAAPNRNEVPRAHAICAVTRRKSSVFMLWDQPGVPKSLGTNGGVRACALSSGV
jgi:hypothetical protein